MIAPRAYARRARDAGAWDVSDAPPRREVLDETLARLKRAAFASDRSLLVIDDEPKNQPRVGKVPQVTIKQVTAQSSPAQRTTLLVHGEIPARALTSRRRGETEAIGLRVTAAQENRQRALASELSSAGFERGPLHPIASHEPDDGIRIQKERAHRVGLRRSFLSSSSTC